MNPIEPSEASSSAPQRHEPRLSDPLATAPGGSIDRHVEPGLAAGSGLERTVQQVVSELVRERRAERRWRNFWRLVLLSAVAALLYFGFHQGQKAMAPSVPHTALIEIRGEIAVGAEASAEPLMVALKQAFEDKGAQAVVLRINSPGGSPVQAGLLNDEILRLKALHRKKVYAVVEEVCASGAYYIAVAADAIYVDKASLVGSIGVLMDGFGFVGLMEKLGIERRLLTAGTNKGMLDPFSPQNDKQRAFAQTMIDQVHQQFIEVVKRGRGDRLKPTPDMFSGLFWNGEQAVQLGLADELGSLEYVAREVVKAAELVDYTPRENLAERLAKRFGAAIGDGAVRALRQTGRLQ
jgi:protease IV